MKAILGPGVFHRYLNKISADDHVQRVAGAKGLIAVRLTAKLPNGGVETEFRTRTDYRARQNVVRPNKVSDKS